MERKGPVDAGVGKNIVHAATIIHQLLFNLDGAFSGHDLDQQHDAAEAVVAGFHALSDARYRIVTLQPGEGRQAEGEAVVEWVKSGRRSLIVVRFGDIVELPARNIDVSALPKLQIVVSRSTALRLFHLKVVYVGVALMGLSALAIEPGLTIPSRNDRVLKINFGS